MDYDVLFRFFEQSLDAVNEGTTDFNLAIANSVIWAVALDETLTERCEARYTEARDASREGQTLYGLRLSRNAILHGQTFAIQEMGLGYPLQDPLFYGPPHWKSYDELTRSWTPRNRGASLNRLRKVYEHEIAGADLGTPLWTAREWLEGARDRRWEF